MRTMMGRLLYFWLRLIGIGIWAISAVIALIVGIYLPERLDFTMFGTGVWMFLIAIGAMQAAQLVKPSGDG